jgi:hypothetical protein
MNLADYLSELLGQQDEVSVPGLGYFMRTRINAFYNEAEHRFYPPYHQVTFLPPAKDDDTFAQFVADKKNISLASSKYFVEKFIAKLREDAANGKYLFADLGSFQGSAEQLVFKPSDRIPVDPAFFGYAPVEIFKVGKQSSDQPGTSSTTATAATSSTPEAVQHPEYFNEDAEPRKRLSPGIIIAIAVLVVACAVFALFQFYPSAFDGVINEYHKLTGKKTAIDSPVIRHEVKKDTVKKPAPLKDSVSKIAATVTKPDTIAAAELPRFEAIVEEASRLKLADAAVARLKKLGFDAYIVQAPGTGPLLKISVGKYRTYASADSVINGMLKAHVIKNHHAPLEIKPT